MVLTVSKRLEFSASRRLFSADKTEEENLAAFGPESSASYGTGRNYTAFFAFTGEVDRANGMLVNISAIKERVQKILHAHFDHKFLNEDHPAFAKNSPTAEDIARQLFLEVTSSFRDSNADLVVCHLVETPDLSATVYSSGTCEVNYWFDFSAARRTMSPQLTTRENERLFGLAASIHGHNYRARLTFRSEAAQNAAPIVRHVEIARFLQSLRAELDHKNLNSDVAGLINQPITTESLARYLHQRVEAHLPIHRIRLYERDDFFAEYWNGGDFFLGMRKPFSAAHRLHAPSFSDAQNLVLYGKCNNPRGHGHLYLTETTIRGKYDERSGTLYSFSSLQNGIEEALKSWQNKHLDLETEEFRELPSTGENIVRALWPKVNSQANEQLVRLRLWETPNNRFTLRKTLEGRAPSRPGNFGT